MKRERRRLLVGWCVLVVLASATVTPVAGASPTVTLTVDGEPVAAGSETLVRADPTVEVRVEASAPIELVDVRVDGDIRWSREPVEPSVETTVPLDLESGTNEVTVVANADGVSSVSATVVVDDRRPRVAYTAPFETSVLAGVPEEVRVETAATTLAGDIVDDAGVTRLTVDRAYTYERAGTTLASRRHHAQRDPGGSFEQPLLLGNGRNNVTAQYTDRLGQIRVDSFVIVVDDTTAPTVDVSVPARTSAETVQLTGTVRDAVKVTELRVTRPDGTEAILVQTDAEPDRGQLAVGLDETVALRDGTNEIVVTARDPAGNTATETVTVERTGDVDPRVNVTARPVAGAGDTVRVAGTVSGGPVTRVTVESVDEATGDRLDVVQVRGGEPVTRVGVNESLVAANASTTVRVLVTDADGTQHESTVVAEEVTEATTTPATDTDDASSQPAESPVESSQPAESPVESAPTESGERSAVREPSATGDATATPTDTGAQDESVDGMVRRMMRKTVAAVKERVRGLTSVETPW